MLNAHPEVLCLHAITNAWATQTQTPRLKDDLAYLRILEQSGGSYRLAGDCHGIARESVPRFRELFGDRFRACVLVRHPIPRVGSFLRYLAEKDRRSYKLDYKALRRSLQPALRSLLNDEERLFFVHILGLVNVVPSEVQAGPVFLMEDLVGSPAKMNGLLDHLSAGELAFDERALEKIFSKKILATQEEIPAGDIERHFNAFADWQKTAFRELLKPEARTAYENLGYRFPF